MDVVRSGMLITVAVISEHFARSGHSAVALALQLTEGRPADPRCADSILPEPPSLPAPRYLHETRDPIVNMQQHVAAYQLLLEAAGETDRYVLRTKSQSYHCGFTNDEVLAGFDDLVEWVETGIAPTP